MKKFKIPVEWAVCAMVEIEAETLEDAVKIFDETIDDILLPTETEYIDDSFMRAEQDINGSVEYYRIYN